MSIIEIGWLLLIGLGSGLLAGLFGIGGGTIIVPALILLFSYFSIGDYWLNHIAIACSLATIAGTGLSSGYAHHKNNNIDWSILKKIVLPSMLGTFIGSNLSPYIPAHWLSKILAIFLLYTSYKFTYYTKKLTTQHKQNIPNNSAIYLTGVGIGIFSSLVGIGGSMLLIPFLKKSGLNIRQAIGTSAAYTVPIAISATIGYIVSGWNIANLPKHSIGFIYWPAVIIIITTSIPAARLGEWLSRRISATNITKLFGILLFAVAIKLIIS